MKICLYYIQLSAQHKGYILRKDYIPARDFDFLVWIDNFAEVLAVNSVVLKLESTKVTEIQSLTAVYKTTLEKALSPEGSHRDTFFKNSYKKELTKCIRNIVSGNLNYNPAMTAILRNEMGLHPRNPRRRRAQKLTVRPRLEVFPGIQQTIIRYRDEESGRRAKPRGVRGITFHWALLDDPPESPENLNKTVSKTSGSLVLDFSENERGKALYIAARWENTIGEGGPWSDIMKAHIA